MSELLKVFVYGTLKPSEANYDRYCKPWVIEAKAAIAYGRLYDLPIGYPALTGGNFPVFGFLLYFDSPEILIKLDELEDYQPDRPIEANEYFRTKTDVFASGIDAEFTDPPRLEQAWVYQMRPALIDQLGGVWLPEGEWTGVASNLNNPSVHLA